MTKKFISIFCSIFGLACAQLIASQPEDADSTSRPSDTLTIDRTHRGDTTSNLELTRDEFVFGGAPYATLSGRLPLRSTSVDLSRAVLVGAAYTGMFVSFHFIQKNAWWRERSDFHILEEWRKLKQIDKFGHAFGAYLESYFFSHALLETGFDWDDATLYGAVMALLTQTLTEIEDGYSRRWGFSPSDEYANAFGSAFFVAQHYLPPLQNIIPRWQYVPVSWSGASEHATGNSFIDDYSSTSFWYSLKIHNMLPAAARDYWPKWLMMSFGYAVQGIEQQGVVPSRRYMVALDYDLGEILPAGPGFWNWMRQTLNHFKLPSPVIEFGETTQFYLLFPFRLSIGKVRF
ncbi:MAG: DUF2279 domain-containing protein [bacterium]|nr:DUF2279 domain-containing protein [Candidatus Kapabacteria bacterium]